MSGLCLRTVHADEVSRGLLDCLEALAPVNLSTAEAFHLLVERQKVGIHTLGAFLDGKLVATATLFLEQKLIHRGGLVGHIEDVAVRPDKHGMGIGRRLVEYLVGICRAAGCYKVLLNCEEKNVVFYQKLGFHKHDTGMRLDCT